jgi:hypothetical protein
MKAAGAKSKALREAVLIIGEMDHPRLPLMKSGFASRDRGHSRLNAVNKPTAFARDLPLRPDLPILLRA